MVLDLGKKQVKSIFPRRSDEGLGKRPAYEEITYTVAQDGTGDFDTIVEALREMSSDQNVGGAILIKAGTYLIKSTINIPANKVTLMGVGKSTVLQAVGDLDPLIQVGSNGAVIIKDLTLQAEIDAGHTNSTGIEAGGSILLSVLNVSFYYFRKNAIELDGTAQRVMIQNCSFNANYDVGIYLGNCYKSRIIGNNLIGNLGHHMHLNTANKNVISGNYIGDGDADGILLAAADNNIINGNFIYNNTGTGINISNNTCDKNIVIGNEVYGNTAAQITDNGTNTHPNGASGTTNLALDDLNIIA